MSRFWLSRASVADLREIRRYTHEQFGLGQAIKVRDRFRDTFRELSRLPYSAPRREEYDPPGKAFRYGVVLARFVIVYEPTKGGIRVARVLHGARDLASVLASDAGAD